MPDAGSVRVTESRTVLLPSQLKRGLPSGWSAPATLPTLFLGLNEAFMMLQKTCFLKVGWRKTSIFNDAIPATHTQTACMPAENQTDPFLVILSSCRLSQAQ